QLTGIYVLQVNRFRFNQYAISAVCPNCKVEDETFEHFLLHCSALEQQPLDFAIFGGEDYTDTDTVANAKGK
ncbi:hypothetical protein DPMN_027070, partial [Dreissena polymorpha]